MRGERSDIEPASMYEGVRHPRRLLGALLRTARQERGLTLVALAADTGIHYSVLSRMERGQVVVTANDVSLLLKTLNADDHVRERAESLVVDIADDVVMWDLADEDQTAMQSRWFDAAWQYTNLRSYRIDVVPGHVQTSEYTESLFGATSRLLSVASDEEVVGSVRTRLLNQGALNDPAKQFDFVLHESVFMMAPVSPRVLADQARRLATLAVAENIDIGVIRAGSAVDCVSPSFTLLDRSVLEIDFPLGRVGIRSSRAIEYYERTFASLREAAVHREDAYEVFMEVADRLERGFTASDCHFTDARQS